jgi:hypothetical protein
MDYEFKIEILDKHYLNPLIIALAHQGYAPYLTEENNVCITISDSELTKIKE